LGRPSGRIPSPTGKGAANSLRKKGKNVSQFNFRKKKKREGQPPTEGRHHHKNHLYTKEGGRFVPKKGEKGEKKKKKKTPYFSNCHLKGGEEERLEQPINTISIRGGGKPINHEGRGENPPS